MIPDHEFFELARQHQQDLLDLSRRHALIARLRSKQRSEDTTPRRHLRPGTVLGGHVRWLSH